jgi:hypothetical protein
VWNVLFGVFLIIHGLVHALLWLTPLLETGGPFNPRHSWLLSKLGMPVRPVRVIAICLALIATVAFVGGGAGLFAQQGWVPTLTSAAAAVSLALVFIYFHPRLSFAVLLNLGILALMLQR